METEATEPRQTTNLDRSAPVPDRIAHKPKPDRPAGPMFLVAIYVALAAIFALDLSFNHISSASPLERFNVSALYTLVIFLTIRLWRVPVVLTVTAASLLLNLIALRLSVTDSWTVLDHMVGLTLQSVTGFLTYRMVLIQCNYRDEYEATLARQRQLYLSERSARESEQHALEEARTRAVELTQTLRKEREARGQRDYLRELTGRFQQMLLPPVPQRISDLCLGALYQPAIHEMHVGGDFYGVIDLGENQVGLFIGDVAGHGVEAAAHSATVMATLRAYAIEHPSNPQTVIERLNRTLTLDSAFDGFVSLFYGVYNGRDKKLRFVNAGHELPILLRGDTIVEGLPSTGMVVGILTGSEYAMNEIELHPGDAIVLLTDGITEARNGNGTFLNWDEASRIAARHRYLLEEDTDLSSNGSKRLAESIFQQKCTRSAGLVQRGFATMWRC
jgi:serine phosphatase RsbU (regulator of sigma subunit)